MQMFNYERLIAMLFEQSVNNDLKSEFIRQILDEHHFNPRKLFRSLLFEDSVNVNEMQLFLEKNKQQIEINQIKELFYNYGGDSIKISEYNLLHALKPREPPLLPYQLKATYAEITDQQLEFYFIQLIIQDLQNYEDHKYLLKKLLEDPEFDLQIAFKTIDPYMTGAIDYGSFVQYFQQNKLVLNDAQMQTLFRLLKCEETQLVPYQQFKKFILQQQQNKAENIANQYNDQQYLQNEDDYFFDKQFRNSQSQKQLQEYVQLNQQKFQQWESQLQEKEYDLNQREARLMSSSQMNTSPVQNNFMDQSYTYKYVTNRNKYINFAYSSRGEHNQPKGILKHSQIQNAKEINLFSQSDSNIINTNNLDQRSNNNPNVNIDYQNFVKQKQKLKTNGNIENKFDMVVTQMVALIDIDRQIENQQVQLSMRRDFNLINGFEFFDQTNKEYVTSHDFINILSEIGIQVSQQDIFLFLLKYDSDKDGMLNYDDFCTFIVPRQESHMQQLSLKQPSLQKYPFSNETRKLLNRLINLLIKAENYQEQIRQACSKFDYEELFQFFDVSKQGYISIKDFIRVFAVRDFFFNLHDIVPIFQRYDKNNDCQINYNEFLNEISPKLQIDQQII